MAVEVFPGHAHGAGLEAEHLKHKAEPIWQVSNESGGLTYYAMMLVLFAKIMLGIMVSIFKETQCYRFLFL